MGLKTIIYKARNWQVQSYKLVINMYIFHYIKLEKNTQRMFYMSIAVVIANQVVLCYGIE